MMIKWCENNRRRKKKSRVGSSALYNSENKLVGIDGWVEHKVSEYDLVFTGFGYLHAQEGQAKRCRVQGYWIICFLKDTRMTGSLQRFG